MSREFLVLRGLRVRADQVSVRTRAAYIAHRPARSNHPGARFGERQAANLPIARWHGFPRKGPPGSPSVSPQQPFHVSNNGRWRLRQSLNAPSDLIGADRADIDAEFLGLFEETRVTVGGEKRHLQRFGAFVRHTGRRREWARHGEQWRLRK